MQDHSLILPMILESLKEERIVKYAAKELATLLHTLINIECGHESELKGLRVLLEECVNAKRRSEYSELHLSSIICSVAELIPKSGKVNDEILRILLEEVLSTERCQNLSSQNLAGILYAVGKLGLKFVEKYVLLHAVSKYILASLP